MRKFLRLSLASLLTLTCSFAYADEVTFDWSDVTATNVVHEENIYTEEPITLTFAVGENTSNNWPSENKEGSIRMYVGTTLNVAADNGYLITKIEFTATGSSYDANNLTYNGSAISNSWTLETPSQEVLLTASKNARFKTIVVSYTASTADYVAAPTIDGKTTFEGSTEVTITGAEGSTIYYTLDGTDPTTSSTSGTSPVTFTLNESATVKAIAVLNGNQSDVATKEFTKVEFTDMTVAEIHELTEDQANINLTIENGKVVYIDNSYSTPSVYIRDGENAIMFFSTTLPFTANATVSGTVKVDYDNYYGIHEVKSNSFTDASGLTITASDEVAQPITVTIADLLDLNHICDLVKIESVTIRSEVSGQYTNYYASDGTNEVQLYGNEEVIADYANDGNTYNVTAVFNNIFSGRAEIKPISVELSTGISNVTVEDEFDENAPVYNLAGQRVSKDARGILIQNGRKFIRK